MPRFYETTLSITNLHNLSISTHVNRSRIYSITKLGGGLCIYKYSKIIHIQKIYSVYLFLLLIPISS